jgi:hypothetical protein
MVNTDTVTVTITGRNFQTGCSAWLGSVPLVISSCTPTMTVGASVPLDIVAGYYDLTVVNPDNRSGTLPNAYTATNPIPLVTDITPALSVITTTDLVVTISGSDFRSAGTPGNLRADLAGTPLTTVTYVSPVTLTAVVPFSSPGVALGAYTLNVINPGPANPSGSLVNAFTVYTYTSTCDPEPACYDSVGAPDDGWVGLTGGDVITLDFGLDGITDGPGYDMVFYEWPNPDIDGNGERGILVDYTTVQLSTDGSAWYTVFEWDGDNPGDVAGTSIDAYAADDGLYPGETENEPISWYDLYPGPPSASHNAGIAIDIGVAAQAVLPPQDPLPPGPFRFVRISYPAAGTDIAQIDAVVRLH